jgi:hypothetical protein
MASECLQLTLPAAPTSLWARPLKLVLCRGAMRFTAATISVRGPGMRFFMCVRSRHLKPFFIATTVSPMKVGIRLSCRPVSGLTIICVPLPDASLDCPALDIWSEIFAPTSQLCTGLSIAESISLLSACNQVKTRRPTTVRN